ncbi:MAG: glycosyltransferase [Chitinophagaceae bacterium]
MRIAVITRCLAAGRSGENFDFSLATLSRITRQHPDHQFIFFCDQAHDAAVDFSANVTPVVLGSPARNALLLKWWYDVKLPAALQKMKADILVCMDGITSLNTSLPQVLVMREPMNKRNGPKHIGKAAIIVTLSEFAAQEIKKQYPAMEKIQSVGAAAHELFQPAGWQEKEQTKETFTGGREYFLYTSLAGENPALLNILKAFSMFKKRQMSNMQLLCLSSGLPTKGFREKLMTYKYRDDVQIITGPGRKDLARLTAGSYAILYPGPGGFFAAPVAEAMQCGIPCITSREGSIPELGGHAMIVADFNNPEDIAAQLKQIFKDENLRSQLVANALEQSQNYTWEKTADAIWDIIKTIAAGQA